MVGRAGRRSAAAADALLLRKPNRAAELARVPLPLPPLQTPAMGVQVRWAITWLMFAATSIMYLVRTAPSSTSVDMMRELGWTEVQKGYFLGSFYGGYIVSQIPGGLLARRYGGKLVLLGGTVLPMAMVALTPVVARHGSFGALLAVRFTWGLFEGVCYPSLLELLQNWSLPHERARQCTVTYIGQACGSILALLMTPSISSRYGWAAPYYAYALVGVAWSLVWGVYASNGPRSHRWIKAAEVERYPAAGALSRAAPALPPLRVWRALLRSPSLWSIISANFTTNFVMYVLLSYIPTYFKYEFDVDTKADPVKSGYLSAIPFVAMMALAPAASIGADVLLRRGATRPRVRRDFQAASYVVSAVFLVLLMFAAPSMAVAEVWLSASVAGLALHSSGYVAHTVDVGGVYAATINSMSNTAGTLPGVIAVPVAGALLHHYDNSFTPVFAMCVAANCAGLVVWCVLFRGTPIATGDGDGLVAINSAADDSSGGGGGLDTLGLEDERRGIDAIERELLVTHDSDL